MLTSVQTGSILRLGSCLEHRARDCRNASRSASGSVDQERLPGLLSHAVPQTVRIGKFEWCPGSSLVSRKISARDGEKGSSCRERALRRNTEITSGRLTQELASSAEMP